MSGVVDPIRVPAALQPIVDRVRAWPRIAQVFVGLTVLDVLGRAIGLVEPDIYLSTDNPITFVSAFLPRDAFILLPALIVLRRRDAESATPLVLWGAVILALRELLWTTTASLVGRLTPEDPGPLFWLSGLGAVVLGVGWFVLGQGLARLNPRDVRAPIAGLANVGLWLVAGNALFVLVATVLARPNIANDPGTGGYELSNIVAAVSMLGFATFVRAVLRGLEDPSRSLPVTRLAAIGVLLTAVIGLLASVLHAFAVAGFPFLSQLASALGPTLAILSDLVGYTLVLVAFGLGFAAPLRPLASEWARAEAAPA